MKFQRRKINNISIVGAKVKLLSTKNMQYFLKLRFCVHLLYSIVLIGFVAALFLIFLGVDDEKVTSEPTFKSRDNFTTVKPEIVYNMSCYYVNNVNVYQADENFSPVNEKSIFFFVTSCFGNVTMLQACAVESAARSHPKWSIYVLFSSGVINITSKSFLGELLQYRNVKVARIPVHEYFKDALLESLLKNDSNKIVRPEDFSNILRMVILNKWGGMFIEEDMLVFRSFESLPRNWVAKEENGVSSRLLAFGRDEVGRNITSKIIEELSKTYDPELEQYSFSNTITRVLNSICPEVFLTAGTRICDGVSVYSRDLFYPITYSNNIFDIEDSDVDVGNLKIPYSYHHLLKLADYNSLEENDDRPIIDLANKFCPYTYYRYSHIELGLYNLT